MSGDNHSVNIDGSKVGAISTGSGAKIDSRTYENCVFYNLNENGTLSTKPPIDLSYYRIDRDEQLTKLKTIISKPHTRPWICVFCGDFSQCLIKFLECLRDSRWRTDVFGRNGGAPRLEFIDWPWETTEYDDLRHRVTASLANEFDMPAVKGAREAINGVTKRTPVMVHTMITPDRFSQIQDGGGALTRFVQFWESWPGRGNSDPPFLACLVVLKGRRKEPEKAPTALRLWDLFGRIFSGGVDDVQDIESYLKQFSDDRRLPEFKKFKSVRLHHVFTWAQEHDIQERVRRSGLDPAAAIHKIFEERDSDSIPMQDMAQALAQRFPISHVPDNT